ncbi:MAG TPA: metalloregulator ArsR/SmtB family transcription factor [Tepidisphaeraceae bacterium]|nr:metalloregulator ArsR/SmtB family transcription factor [Tepidisphaeraceae bacterium]
MIDNHAAIKTTDAGDLDQLVALFKLLADRTRLTILLMLSEGERNVSTLCGLLNLPQPTVSHHLALMRMSNIITSRRNGKQVFYSLNSRVERPQTNQLVVTVDRFSVTIDPRGTQGEAQLFVSSNVPVN